jgi:hypothetical protein
MEGYYYRFRPVEALLNKFEELEKQEIYFAPVSELNDPLDGFKNIFWKGDRILWNGLLKHYLLCLMQAALEASLSPDDGAILDRISVFGTEEELQTPELRRLYARIRQVFFGHADIAPLSELLGNRQSRVGRNELIMYLRTMHLHALNSVVVGFEDVMGIPPRPEDDPLKEATRQSLVCRQLVEAMNLREQNGLDAGKFAEAAAEASETIVDETNLLLAYQRKSFASRPAWKAVTFDFPPRYVSSLERLLYRDWYTACFVDNPDNTAMWGTYGEVVPVG